MGNVFLKCTVIFAACVNLIRFGGSTAYLTRLWTAKAAQRATVPRRGDAEEETEEEQENQEEMSAPRGFKPLMPKTSKLVSNDRGLRLTAASAESDHREQHD